jgi:hypothetical protein
MTDPSSRQRGSSICTGQKLFKQEEISSHEPQTGLDTKADRLTDRQSQCDFDSDFDFDTLEHRSPVKRFVSLQFFSGSDRRKAATYTNVE